MWSIIDIIPFFFDFFEPGGTNNLLPGRPLEQSRRFTRPPRSGFFLTLTGISGSFIHPGGTLTERPLGQFKVWTRVSGPDTVICRVRLTDENMDDAIHIQVNGLVVLIA
jgi:hypothetical protein